MDIFQRLETRTMDGVVERFRKLMDDRTLTQAQAARLLSTPKRHCSASVVSQLLSGTYQGRVAEWQKEMERVIARLEREARSPHEPPFLKTSVAGRIWKLLDYAHSLGRMGLILGSTGVGKSAAASAYCANQPDTILVTAFQGMTPRHLIVQIAQALHLDWDRSFGYMVGRVGMALSGARRLILIDEADFLASALHIARHLHDTSRCGAVLLGTKAFLSRLRRNSDGTEGQVLGRMRVLTIERIEPEDAEILAQQMDISKELARRAYDGWEDTPGALGQARRLIQAFITARLDADGSRITEQHLKAAFGELMHQ